MSADAQFKQLIDRILRCREAEDAAKDDTKEVYAELKGLGYDKSAAGALVGEIRKKEKNPDQFAERSTVLDLYRDAYERASHTHTREGRKGITPETHVSQGVEAEKGPENTVEEITQEQPETANEIHERPSINAEASPEVGLQAEASQSQDTGVGTLAGHEGRSEGEAASADLPTIPHSSEPSSSPVQADNAGEVQPPASPATFSDDDVPAFLRKQSKPLRPLCQHPDNCAGYGTHTCHGCKKAMAEGEAA